MIHAVAVSPSAVLGMPAFAPGQAVALDFTSSRFRVGVNGLLVSDPSLLPGWSFSRSTGKYALTSTGALQFFAANAPAVTGLGISIEGAGTNLQLQSQDCTAAAWTKTGVTASKNVSTAPDGTLTANKLTEDTSNGQHIAFVTTAQTSGTTYTDSIFVRAAERGFAVVRTAFSVPDSGFIVNLATGATSAPFGSLITASSVQALAGGWFRVSYTYADNTTQGAVVVGPALNATTFSYAGDGASGIFVWGAQLEQAAVASSYIAAATAAATRAADVASLAYSPNGSAATVTFGASSSASISPTSPINLGASSAGAWVGSNLKTLMVVP